MLQNDMSYLLITFIGYITVITILYLSDSFKNNNLFNYCGRLNRLAYFTRLICFGLVSFSLQAMLQTNTINNDYNIFLLEMTTIIIIQVIFEIMICVDTIKRLHDLNLSGKYLFFYLLSLVILVIIDMIITLLNFKSFFIQVFSSIFLLSIDFIVIILLLVIKGTSGDNQYGSDPLLNKFKSNNSYQ